MEVRPEIGGGGGGGVGKMVTVLVECGGKIL